jgi:hypothetical protein
MKPTVRGIGKHFDRAAWTLHHLPCEGLLPQTALHVGRRDDRR